MGSPLPYHGHYLTASHVHSQSIPAPVHSHLLFLQWCWEWTQGCRMLLSKHSPPAHTLALALCRDNVVFTPGQVETWGARSCTCSLPMAYFLAVPRARLTQNTQSLAGEVKSCLELGFKQIIELFHFNKVKVCESQKISSSQAA